MKNPGKKASKFRVFLSFLGMELLILGISLIFADNDITSGIPLSEAAKFLGLAIFFHVAMGLSEIRSWKKSQKPLNGYLR